MKDPPSYTLSVNQNFYQYHRTNDLQRFTPGTPAYEYADSFRAPYLIPYAFQTTRRRVAVVGAGGGLDVESALLTGRSMWTRWRSTRPLFVSQNGTARPGCTGTQRSLSI